MRHTAKTLQDLGVNPGYIEVFLDGAPIEGVVAFDEIEGCIVRYLKDSAGDAVVRDDSFQEETLRGEVRAELKWTADGKWPHALPRPETGKRPLVRSIIT